MVRQGLLRDGACHCTGAERRRGVIAGNDRYRQQLGLARGSISSSCRMEAVEPCCAKPRCRGRCRAQSVSCWKECGAELVSLVGVNSLSFSELVLYFRPEHRRKLDGESWRRRLRLELVGLVDQGARKHYSRGDRDPPRRFGEDGALGSIVLDFLVNCCGAVSPFSVVPFSSPKTMQCRSTLLVQSITLFDRPASEQLSIAIAPVAPTHRGRS